MSEELKQAAAVPEAESMEEEQVRDEEQMPDGAAIGISENDLSELGDLSVLQEQDLEIPEEVSVDDGDEDGAVSALEQELSAAAAASNGGAGQADMSVQAVNFQPLTPSTEGQGDLSSIDMLMDVPLKITVELGRTKMIVREVLDLQSGSVVELDRMAGEVVDVFINERLIARGEVVVVDDKFGVRITEMLGGFGKGKNKK